MTMKIDNTFPKNEKLKSKKVIAQLFNQGKTINAYPIKVIYLHDKTASNPSINTGVSIPKKVIKLAVNRNLLKRRIKEAYRLNVSELKSHLLKENEELQLMFIYTSKQISSYEEIEQKIKVILTRLIKCCGY